MIFDPLTVLRPKAQVLPLMNRGLVTTVGTAPDPLSILKAKAALSSAATAASA